jgi:hypothetical protein
MVLIAAILKLVKDKLKWKEHKMKKSLYSHFAALLVGDLLSKGEATQEQFARAEWYHKKSTSQSLLEELGYNFKSWQAIKKYIFRDEI